MRKIRNGIEKINNAIIKGYVKAKTVMTQNAGEGYVDTAVKVLMAVVIGALVLAGLYALFNDTVMPTLTKRIKEMFDYAG